MKPIYAYMLFILFTSCENKNIEKKYYSNGKVQYEVPLNSLQKRHGEMIQYYIDGSIKSASNWEKGVLSGERKIYFPNGKIQDITFFVDNKPSGWILHYYPSGNLKQKNFFLKGLKCSVTKHYYDISTPTLFAEDYYILQNGKASKVGWIEYNKTGKISSASRCIKMECNKDTVLENEYVTFSLELIHPRFDSTIYMISAYNSDFKINSIGQDTISSTHHKAIYKVKGVKKGWNFVVGYAENFNIIWNDNKTYTTESLKNIYFEYPYYVK